MNNNQIKNINELEISPQDLRELIEMFQKREISNAVAKEVLLEMFKTKKTPKNRDFYYWHDQCLRDGRLVNRVTASELELEHRQRHTTQQYGEIRE